MIEMKRCGIEQVCILPFDKAMAALSPQEFVQEILLNRLNAKQVWVGDDFRFGAKRAGDFALLKQLGDAQGFVVNDLAEAHIVALEVTGKPYSSEQLAQRLEHWRTLGRDIALLIGGPEGHAPDVVAAAHEKWSLSPLTLPHMLVRLVVAEQVYRAAAMLANHPYHRA